ncbi:MAG: hypothetical protein WEE64_10475 [Dehalococcoidia bacterium]
MVAGTALILFRSALFRDVFAKLLSGWANTVRTRPLPEAVARPLDLGPEQEVTVLLEVIGEDEQLRDTVCSYLFAATGKSLRVYIVDLRRDQMTEYRRKEYRTIDVIRQPAGANSN